MLGRVSTPFGRRRRGGRRPRPQDHVSPERRGGIKTLGIVGGIGPESTIEYYRFILDGCLGLAPERGAPRILIDRIDVNAARDEAKRLGLRRLALLGTGFTMRAGFYPEVFAGEGIRLVTPGEAERHPWARERRRIESSSNEEGR